MNPAAVLALGFVLGMRHATDADHVVAVSTIVSRRQSLRSAAPIGMLWGIGHTLTILLVGALLILFGIAVPPRLGLSLELLVALMLVLLGCLNLREQLRNHHIDHVFERSVTSRPSLRPVMVGVVHGLAGSAAIALLVLQTIQSAAWAIVYLLVFGIGTIAGMSLVTAFVAMPMAMTARRFERLHRTLVSATAFASLLFGLVLVYEIGFTHGLFTGDIHWIPR
jgi:high-affinity nickel-transport protein